MKSHSCRPLNLNIDLQKDNDFISVNTGNMMIIITFTLISLTQVEKDISNINVWAVHLKCFFFCYNSQLSLLESLPSLAVHGFVLPLSLQLISSMLKKDVKS